MALESCIIMVQDQIKWHIWFIWALEDGKNTSLHMLDEKRQN